MYYGMIVMDIDNPMLGSTVNKKSVYWSKSEFVISQYAKFLRTKSENYDIQLIGSPTLIDLGKELYKIQTDQKIIFPSQINPNIMGDQLTLIHDENDTRYAIATVRTIERLLLNELNDSAVIKMESIPSKVLKKICNYSRFVNKSRKDILKILKDLSDVIKYEVSLDTMLLIMELYPDQIYELR